ncbi:MAG TPA: TonB-dependent receptor plug domain-containing protein, partial [Sphingomonadaceae bacterium]|nr:TonB-dependent receptor plug domain-containing protein [Sphingomonadaceae bacterium]
MRLNLFAAVSITAVALGMSTGVAAQDQAADPALAGPAGEIIVTAQRRVQNLQDVANSVSALSGNDLERARVNTVLDLNTLVPNVTIGDSFGQADIAIRGQGRTGPISGADPAVALHVDGAVVSKVQAQLASFFDLERVEVLRGPQGTLYGRNSTGGAVNLITRKPTETLEGYVRATYGNYDLVETTGAISGPIAGNLLGRLSWRTQNRSGFGINEVSGADIDDANQRSLRGQLQLNATPDLTLRIAAEWHREDDAAYGFKYYGAGYPGTTDSRLVALGIGGYATGGPRNIRSEAPISNKRDTWALTGTIDWRFNDNWTLQSLTNYRKIVNNPIVDFDSSSVVNPVISNNYLNAHQFSQEFQLQYDGNGVNGLLGLFY